MTAWDKVGFRIGVGSELAVGMCYSCIGGEGPRFDTVLSLAEPQPADSVWHTLEMANFGHVHCSIGRDTPIVILLDPAKREAAEVFARALGAVITLARHRILEEM